MTTDIAVVERALVVMAVAVSVQAFLCLAASVAAVMAWRRATEGLIEARAAAEAQMLELRGQLDRISARVDDAALALLRGTSAVDGVVADMRDAVGSVRNSVGSVASVVTAPRAALAIGAWRGVQIWRKRRAAQRAAKAAAAAAAAERRATDGFPKETAHGNVE
jgi:hypothetical protein